MNSVKTSYCYCWYNKSPVLLQKYKILKDFETNQKVSKFAMGNIKLSKEEKELIEAIRLYKKLENESRLFTDYILYLRGYIEQILESNNE